jgi:hypothetical protein
LRRFVATRRRAEPTTGQAATDTHNVSVFADCLRAAPIGEGENLPEQPIEPCYQVIPGS